MSSNRFFAGDTEQKTTTAGEADLPIRYYDGSVLLCLFEADAAALEQELSAVELVPARFGSRALAALVFYEYRDTTIGPYNEVGLATFALPRGVQGPSTPWLDLARPPRARRVGMYVLDLPVTTPIANAAGRELWGLPKFVTRIDFERRGRRFIGEIHDPSGGGSIARLSGGLGLPLPMPPMEPMLYSRLGTTELRTEIKVRGMHSLRVGQSLRLQVGGSSHRMAENLRRFGLKESARLAIYAPRAQMVLPLGQARAASREPDASGGRMAAE